MDKEVLNNISSKIVKFFSCNGIELTNLQAKQFSDYYLLLTDWNKNINLTAITEIDDVIVKHFFDSSVCFKELKDNATLIDVGCGAGFPSIPLKILRPDLKLILLDSVNKKINFINALINKLQLTETCAIHSRAEDLACNPKYREKYDYCVSRAVAGLNVLCEYCLPFVKVGGAFFAYKSVGAEEEIVSAKNAIQILGGDIETTLDFAVADYCRKVIKIKKTKQTNSKYPRKNNKPRTSPLV